ncbi:hypothetical protein [Mixta theicola]|uniref:hypothetical protein n=1 Tax=Mixta theicola TaxID=1458355 RepID=UPI0013FE2055|nr:hypothetical protein [Mixta theicola]
MTIGTDKRFFIDNRSFFCKCEADEQKPGGNRFFALFIFDLLLRGNALFSAVFARLR